MKGSNLLRKQTVLNRYGVDNVSKLSCVQSKRLSTFYANRPCIKYARLHPFIQLDGSTMQIYRINKDVSDQWLNSYHPLGAPRGTLLPLGLVKDNIIYCMMTFRKPRNTKYSVELSRMWMLPTYYVTNGYNMLSDYATQFGLYNIVAYVNLTFELFEEYEKIGMHSTRDIQRRKWWIGDNDVISDATRRQRRLTTADMLNKGYHAEWDLGTAVYESDS